MSIKSEKPCNKTKWQRDEPAHEGNPWRSQRAVYWSQCSSSLLQYKMQTEIITRGCRQACEFNAFVVIALNKTMLYIIYCDQRIWIGIERSKALNEPDHNGNVFHSTLCQILSSLLSRPHFPLLEETVTKRVKTSIDNCTFESSLLRTSRFFFSTLQANCRNGSKLSGALRKLPLLIRTKWLHRHMSTSICPGA